MPNRHQKKWERAKKILTTSVYILTNKTHLIWERKRDKKKQAALCMFLYQWSSWFEHHSISAVL